MSRSNQCHILEIFSEPAFPVKAKLHVEHLEEGRTKVGINGPGYMTKVAATPIYDTNLLK